MDFAVRVPSSSCSSGIYERVTLILHTRLSVFFFFHVWLFYLDEKYVMLNVTANRTVANTALFILLVLLTVQTCFGNIRKKGSLCKVVGGAIVSTSHTWGLDPQTECAEVRRTS